MELFRLTRFWFGTFVLVGWGFTAQSATAPAVSPSAEEVIQKAVTRAQHTERQTDKPPITYKKVSVTEELDASGKVRERKERVYQIYLRSGATSVKLLEVNGRPPGNAEARKQSETEMNVRQLLGQSKAGVNENRDNFLTPELAARFDFSIRRQTVIDGRDTYEIAFQPKAQQPPIKRLVDRLLNQISGTIWIDAEESELARAEIHLRSEVGLFGGMVGCLKKLAYSMTRTRVADGVWLTSQSIGNVEGRKLLDSMRIKTKSQSSDFHLLPESR
ncbi:MAG TPA: hypothetical protein VEC99_00890 [Clostridia bacterium]|nr:hypothetical protein [Clostridia bacterium]